MTSGVYKRTKKHWNRGLTKDTDSRIMRNALARIGQIRSPETKHNISLGRKGKGIGRSSAMKGKIPWNKGLIKEIDSRCRGGVKKGYISKVKKTKELYPLLSNSGVKKGNVPWNKGLTKETDDRVNQISLKIAEKYKEPGFFSKVMHRRIPSYPEQIFMNLCEEMSLPYRYVGNGRLIIEGKNPDFVDSTGTKLIEIWGEHFHIGQNPQDRIDFFKVRGYQCIVIRASELKNKEKILAKVKKFMEAKN